MLKSTDRILTTHTGSLTRPPEIVKMLKSKQCDKDFDDSEFESRLNTAVSEVIEKQIDSGIDIVNDGEFGKNISWSRYVVERLSGFEQRPHNADDTSMPKGVFGKDRRDFADFYADYDRTQGMVGMTGWEVNAPIHYQKKSAIERDLRVFRKAIHDVEATDYFVTAVAPSSIIPDREDKFYASDEEYLFALADAMRVEYKAIVDAGFIAQVDDAYLASYYDTIVPPGTIEDYRNWAEIRVDALNHALRDIPRDRLRYHVCWGSWNGPHTTDVPLIDVIDLILKVRVGAYLLEMANPRHEHEWRVWEDVKLPQDTVLIPGVISHATNIVEHPKLVSERIIRLANLVGRENLIAGTDCGFAQGPFVQRVHPTIMWAKLQALADGAHLASEELWG